MSKMFIRVKKDGFIYGYNEILAKNPACEVIPEEVAYPERFIPKHVEQRKAAPKRGRAAKGLSLETEEVPNAPDMTPPELAADASRGMP